MTTTAQAEQIAALQLVLPRLDERSQVFARSLLNQFRVRQSLSVRQWPHVGALIVRAGRGPSARGAEGYALPAAGLATLAARFAAAAGHGIQPAVRVTRDGATLRISAPSPRSQYAGQAVLFVRYNDEYVGRIQNGRFIPKISGEIVARAQVMLIWLLEAPLERLAENGRATGACCYCRRELTDPRSVTHGYGPICAGHYGLPWDAPRETAGEALAEAFREPPLTTTRRTQQQMAAEAYQRAIADRVAAETRAPTAVQNAAPCAADELDDEDRMFMGPAPNA